MTTIKLSTLKPNDRNPRKIKSDALRKLCESIERDPQFMELRPIVIDEDRMILGGNQRFRACQQLGMKEVPVSWVKTAIGLTDEQRRRFILVDNAPEGMAGEWDLEILTTEWQMPELGDLGFDLDSILADLNVDLPTNDVDAEPQIDRAEELRKEWKVETGQLWQLGEHRLLCGDSTKREDVGRVMGGKNADCVFTSPPYAVGIDYGETYKDTIENLRSMLGKLSVLWNDVIVAGGYAVINFNDILSGREIAGSEEPCEYPMAIEYFPIFRAAKWTLWSRRVWCKPGAACGSSRHCIGTNRAASNYEHVWTWKRAGKSIVDDQLTGDWPSQAGWFDTTHENKLGVGLNTHGAGMPPTVAARAVFWHSRSGAIVHEPFCGTGTTIIACERLGRKCRAIEIRPGYVAVALQRFEDATGKTPTLIEGSGL